MGYVQEALKDATLDDIAEELQSRELDFVMAVLVEEEDGVGSLMYNSPSHSVVLVGLAQSLSTAIKAKLQHHCFRIIENEDDD